MQSSVERRHLGCQYLLPVSHDGLSHTHVTASPSRCASLSVITNIRSSAVYAAAAADDDDDNDDDNADADYECPPEQQ